MPSWQNQGNASDLFSIGITEDGEYEIEVWCADKSQNRSETYSSGKLVIDTGINKPEISVNGTTESGISYNSDVNIQAKFYDANLKDYSCRLVRQRKNIREDVTELLTNALKADARGGALNIENLDRSKDYDGIYVLTIEIADKAGHTKSSSLEFTVNRFGGEIIYSDGIEYLAGSGGRYVKNIGESLYITQYSPDKLIPSSVRIRLWRNAEEVDVDHTETQNAGRELVGSSGWYEYRYGILRSNFKRDGIYRITFSAVDQAGNHIGSGDKEILFRVDSTSPDITSIVKAKNRSDGKRTMIYSVYDAIGLGRVEIYENGKKTFSIDDFSDDMNNYRVSDE